MSPHIRLEYLFSFHCVQLMLLCVYKVTEISSNSASLGESYRNCSKIDLPNVNIHRVIFGTRWGIYSRSQNSNPPSIVPYHQTSGQTKYKDRKISTFLLTRKSKCTTFFVCHSFKISQICRMNPAISSSVMECM